MMGYIFDALNKQRGEKPSAAQPPAEALDAFEAWSADQGDGPVHAESATPLADAVASSSDHLDPVAVPLRLADVTAEHPPTDTGPATYVIAEAMQPATADDVACADEQAADIEPVESGQPRLPDTDHDNAASYALPQSKAKASGFGGWWRRLIGKAPRAKIDDRLVTITSPASAVAEEYRSIRTSILARHENQRHLVHTITSATPQEGKTITCVNLGLSFAELRNRKTVIVECDMRLPTFSKLLTCDPDKPGLIDFLRGDAPLKDVIQQVEGSQLFIIPAGGRVSDEAVQLLSGNRMSQLIQAMRAKFDHVLIDTPPVLQLADAGILGSQSEEVLLVARMRRTPRTLIEQAVNTLTSYNAVVNGIIATDNPRSRARGYGYRYGYRYGYGYGYGYTDNSRGKRRKQRHAA